MTTFASVFDSHSWTNSLSKLLYVHIFIVLYLQKSSCSIYYLNLHYIWVLPPGEPLRHMVDDRRSLHRSWWFLLPHRCQAISGKYVNAVFQLNTISSNQLWCCGQGCHSLQPGGRSDGTRRYVWDVVFVVRELPSTMSGYGFAALLHVLHAWRIAVRARLEKEQFRGLQALAKEIQCEKCNCC